MKPCKKNSNSAGLGKAFGMEGCQTRTKLKHFFLMMTFYINIHKSSRMFIVIFLPLSSTSTCHIFSLQVTPKIMIRVMMLTFGNWLSRPLTYSSKLGGTLPIIMMTLHFAYWNLNDKTILTSPGYAWVMNSVSLAVTYLSYYLSMTQYALQCIDSLSTSPCNDSE